MPLVAGYMWDGFADLAAKNEHDLPDATCSHSAAEPQASKRSEDRPGTSPARPRKTTAPATADSTGKDVLTQGAVRRYLQECFRRSWRR